jgi:DNA-binding transcriptional LysR family regulator
MSDLSDLELFALTVKHGGFSAASRVTGIEKSRLSRRVTALEKRLGVSLLHRTTRTVVLTEAGEHFHRHCQSTLESLRATYECLAELQAEPSGTVRISAPLLLAESYLAHVVPEYLRINPKVSVIIEATDHEVDLFADRVDVALRVITRDKGGEPSGVVVRELGQSSAVLVASPDFLARRGSPRTIDELSTLPTLCHPDEISAGAGYWELFRERSVPVVVRHTPSLVTRNIRVQLEAAINGTGIAFLHGTLLKASLREGLLVRLLPEWCGQTSVLGLAYPSPRGMLPSVRSLINFILLSLPGVLDQDFYAEAGRER